MTDGFHNLKVDLSVMTFHMLAKARRTTVQQRFGGGRRLTIPTNRRRTCASSEHSHWRLQGSKA